MRKKRQPEKTDCLFGVARCHKDKLKHKLLVAYECPLSY